MIHNSYHIIDLIYSIIPFTTTTIKKENLVVNSCYFLCHYPANQKNALSYLLLILAKKENKNSCGKLLTFTVLNLNLGMANY